MGHLVDGDILELRTVIVASNSSSHSWMDANVSVFPPAYVITLPANTQPVQTRLDQLLAQLNNDTALVGGLGLPLALFLERLLLDTKDLIVSTAKRLLQTLKLRTGIVSAGGSAAVDAFDELRILAASLFLDREKLRQGIRALARVDGPAALVVNGDDKVGKSHTRNFLAFAAQATGWFRVAWIEIKKSQAASFTPDWLIEDLVRTVVSGTSPVPAKREPVARWLSDLADWAFSELGKISKSPVWLVIDGLRHDAVSDDVRALVEHIAARAATPSGDLKIRLVLIYCDATEIKRTGCSAYEETFEHLTAADAEQALQKLDPARFPMLWPALKGKLATTKVTTPVVSALLEEALKP